MTLKKNAYIILLVFVGYTTVSFAMNNEGTNRDRGAYLRKLGVKKEYIENTLKIMEGAKTPKQITEDFYEISSDDEVKEFVDIEDNELPLEDFPENKRKSYTQATASTISSYYNWFTGLQK